MADPIDPGVTVLLLLLLLTQRRLALSLRQRQYGLMLRWRQWPATQRGPRQRHLLLLRWQMLSLRQ